MYPKYGRLPAHRAFIALLSIFTAASAVADSRSPLTLSEAEDIAVQGEPGLEEIRARATAFDELSVAAGQLPDPTLSIGLTNFPVSHGGFSTEGMTQAQLGYRQAFPKGRSRSMATSRFAAMADEQDHAAGARLRDVLAAARSSWLEVYYWQSAKQLLEESRPFFVDLVTITQSMYSVGRKTQYDVLRAELELARLEDRMIEADRSLAAAQASLSQWLGDDAYRRAAMKLPGWEELPEQAELQQRLALHPMLLAASAAVSAKQAGVNLAEENKKPGWALDVGYGYREGRLPSGEPRSDFISMAVTLDLPFFSKNRQDRKLAAALGERSAADANRDRLSAEMHSELALQYSRWQDLTRRMALFDSEILALSGGQAEAAMLAYQSDAGTFSDVMHGQIDHLDIQLEHIRLKVERAKTYAVLANLGGFSR